MSFTRIKGLSETRRLPRLKECFCGCGRLIPQFDSKGREKKFHPDCFSVGNPLSPGAKAYIARMAKRPAILKASIERIQKVNNEVRTGRRKPGHYIDGVSRARDDGYIMFLRPDHPRSNKKGYVFEHVLVVEKKLGRFLLPEEVVHHIDRDRKNNSPENLMVFPSGGAHQALHSKEDNRRDAFGRFRPYQEVSV